MLHDPKDRKLFPKLGENDIAILQRYGEIVDVKDGAIIAGRGRCRGMFIVMNGRLRAFRRIGNAEELLAFHSKGGFSGDLSVLTKCAAVYSLQSSGDATLLRLDAGGCES